MRGCGNVDRFFDQNQAETHELSDIEIENVSGGVRAQAQLSEQRLAPTVLGIVAAMPAKLPSAQFSAEFLDSTADWVCGAAPSLPARWALSLEAPADLARYSSIRRLK